MAGRTVAWEVIWYAAHANLRKALRRFEPGGTVGRLAEGVIVKVHYPTARTMARVFAPEFRLVRFKGIGVTVPPSYLESYARRFPRVLETFVAADRMLSRVPGFRCVADHILLEFQRVGAAPANPYPRPLGGEGGPHRRFHQPGRAG